MNLLLLGQSEIYLPRPDLRWEFANTAAAVVLLSAALAAIAIFSFRRKTRDLTLICFSLFCILYAVRLLICLPSFHALFAESPEFWTYVGWIISSVLILPGGLFLYQVVGEPFKTFLRWLLAARVLFALCEIFAATVGITPAKLNVANHIVALATLVTTVVFLIVNRPRLDPRKPVTRDVRVLLVGFVVWFLFLLRANPQGPKILPEHNVELLACLIFVACLGYVSAHRTFANGERLLAVDEELEIARRIQSATLPQSVPKLSGLEIVARHIPMSAVAGDFYDFLCVDDRRVGVLIADVTGHGVPAALIASMLKGSFAGQQAYAHDPARVLTGLNRSLCGKFDAHFVTAAYLFLDLERKLLCYSAAGHPPLLLTSEVGNVREFQSNGPVLGVFPEALYSSLEIRVGSGDRCLLYTDGILEPQNAAHEEFGETRCIELLETQTGIPAARFANTLLENIASFSSHNSTHAQEDDITLLVLDFQ